MTSWNREEFERFDATVGKIITVSHDELKRREAEWKKQRKRKKQSKRASRAAGA